MLTMRSFNIHILYIELEMRLMKGVFSNVNDINLFLMIFPLTGLTCKKGPVHYQEYEKVLLSNYVRNIVRKFIP